MLETMWIWGAIGVILLAIEMATGTFYILWFGVAALCVAIAMALFPNMSQAAQYGMFAMLSLGSLAVWRRYYKKTSIDSRVGQAQGEEIGRVGMMTETCSAIQNGKISFTQGLMGSKEWVAVSNETIETGQHAIVIAVEGNALRVSRTSSP
jgi:membrane protein implicated in regulation of membrane protease activity